MIGSAVFVDFRFAFYYRYDHDCGISCIGGRSLFESDIVDTGGQISNSCGSTSFYISVKGRCSRVLHGCGYAGDLTITSAAFAGCNSGKSGRSSGRVVLGIIIGFYGIYFNKTVERIL